MIVANLQASKLATDRKGRQGSVQRFWQRWSVPLPLSLAASTRGLEASTLQDLLLLAKALSLTSGITQVEHHTRISTGSTALSPGIPPAQQLRTRRAQQHHSPSGTGSRGWPRRAPTILGHDTCLVLRSGAWGLVSAIRPQEGLGQHGESPTDPTHKLTSACEPMLLWRKSARQTHLADPRLAQQSQAKLRLERATVLPRHETAYSAGMWSEDQASKDCMPFSWAQVPHNTHT